MASKTKKLFIVRGKKPIHFCGLKHSYSIAVFGSDFYYQVISIVKRIQTKMSERDNKMANTCNGKLPKHVKCCVTGTFN